MEDKKIIYVAELDADVDDVIAVEYLHGLGLLDYVVLDPYPTEEVGLKRLEMIKSMVIEVKEHFCEERCFNVFCGGRLTEIANYLRNGGTIKNLVLQGGFVGSNIVPEEDQLNKFKGKEMVRTFNFNCDVLATNYVLKSTNIQIGKIYCIGKNVCHNPINSDNKLWKEQKYKDLFKKYNVREGKLQHDMLACHEGIVLTGLGEDIGITVPYCLYLIVKPFNNYIDGNKTLWGSKLPTCKTGYREVTSAITFIK